MLAFAKYILILITLTTRDERFHTIKIWDGDIPDKQQMHLIQV